MESGEGCTRSEADNVKLEPAPLGAGIFSVRRRSRSSIFQGTEISQSVLQPCLVRLWDCEERPFQTTLVSDLIPLEKQKTIKFCQGKAEDLCMAQNIQAASCHPRL